MPNFHRVHSSAILRPVARPVLAAGAVAALFVAAVHAQVPTSAPPPQRPQMLFFTDAFEDGARMPGKYTGLAAPSGVSPALTWSRVPPATQSFVLLMHDTEEAANRSSKMDPTHWLLWNIPAASRGLPEGVAEGAELADGRARSASTLTAKAVFEAMDGHVIGKASLVGRSALIPEPAPIPAR